MVVITVFVVVVPFLLAVGLNGRDRTDSRGRRVDRTWRVGRSES
jgi:hypothetical protein